MANDHGLSAVMQCVMVPKSTRVPLSACETMVRFLMSLTISYPDYPIKLIENNYIPKIMVVFNGFSRYDADKEPE